MEFKSVEEKEFKNISWRVGKFLIIINSEYDLTKLRVDGFEFILGICPIIMN